MTVGVNEIQRNITSSLRFPAFGEDPPAFSTTPKVTVTRDSDGTTVLDQVAATKVPAGEDDIEHYVVEIVGTEIPEVDLLRVEWSDGSNSQTSFIEVVGGFVTSLRSIEKKIGERNGPTEQEIVAMREIALRSIEDACGVAFRPRYARETLDGSGDAELLLGHPRLLRVLNASLDGQALDVERLALDVAGVVLSPSSWRTGRGNVEISYAHGHESFPPAALPVRDLAAHLLTPSPTDWNERATSVSNEFGNYSLVVAGVRGASFPLPSVNAFVDQHRYLSVG